MGNTQEIPAGGEQGDPLMPMFFSLGELIDGEKLLAHLNDITVICSPEGVRAVVTIIDEELARHAQVSTHHKKTQVWNRGGVTPPGVEELTRLARVVKPEAVVWRGDTQLLAAQQCGDSWCAHWISRFCASTVGGQVHRARSHVPTPLLEDIQACWLLLLMRAATRENFWLRAVRPGHTESFVDHVWRCVRSILGVEGVPENAQVISQLPFALGELSLKSAVRSPVAAHWSSWADCVHINNVTGRSWKR